MSWHCHRIVVCCHKCVVHWDKVGVVVWLVWSGGNAGRLLHRSLPWRCGPGIAVVPLLGEPDVTCAIPVTGYVVVPFECLEQMVNVLYSDLLNAEIINTECKRNGLPVVLPETWVDFALVIALSLELFFQLYLLAGARPFPFGCTHIHTHHVLCPKACRGQ